MKLYLKLDICIFKHQHFSYLKIYFFPNRLYAAGAQPQISKLYRPLSYPVGRGTPMLNSKIGWDHSERFMVPKFGMDCKCRKTKRDFCFPYKKKIKI